MVQLAPRSEAARLSRRLGVGAPPGVETAPNEGPWEQGELRTAGEQGRKGSHPGWGGHSRGWGVESNLVTGHLETLIGRLAGV